MSSAITASLLVGVGGFAGSIARYGLSLTAQRLAVTWPGGTFAANVLGCLVIGVIAELAARSNAISPEVRLLLATGFCGGFTTMSTLIYEAAAMARAQEWLHAAAYVGATLFCSLTAFVVGVVLVRLILKTAGA